MSPLPISPDGASEEPGPSGWGDPTKFLFTVFLWISATMGLFQGCEAKRDRRRVETQLQEIKALIEGMPRPK